MEHGYTQAVYSIGIVTKLLQVCPETLRIWEKKGLIKPARVGKNRFYSKLDLDRLEQIKDLIQKKRVNIEGAKRVLFASYCWEIKKCKPRQRNSCPLYSRFKDDKRK